MSAQQRGKAARWWLNIGAINVSSSKSARIKNCVRKAIVLIKGQCHRSYSCSPSVTQW